MASHLRQRRAASWLRSINGLRPSLQRSLTLAQKEEQVVRILEYIDATAPSSIEYCHSNLQSADPSAAREGSICDKMKMAADSARDEQASAEASFASQCWEERYAATVRLGKSGQDPCDVVTLLGRFRDDHASVRAAAANALAELHQSSPQGGPMLRITVQGLLVLLEDDEVCVRLMARRSLVACIVIAVRLVFGCLAFLSTLRKCSSLTAVRAAMTAG